MRLVYEFCQLWWIGLGVRPALFGAAFAAMYAGAFAGGWAAGRLADRRGAVLACGAVVVCGAGGLLVCNPVTVIGGQIAAVAALEVVTVALAGRLGDAVPARLRAGTISAGGSFHYATFIPVALAFGLAGRGDGIFTASVWIIGPLAAMLLTLPAALAVTTAAARPRRSRGAPDRLRAAHRPVHKHRSRPGVQARRRARPRHRASPAPARGRTP
jgi:hypothetical protein